MFSFFSWTKCGLGFTAGSSCAPSFMLQVCVIRQANCSKGKMQKSSGKHHHQATVTYLCVPRHILFFKPSEVLSDIDALVYWRCKFKKKKVSNRFHRIETQSPMKTCEGHLFREGAYVVPFHYSLVLSFRCCCNSRQKFDKETFCDDCFKLIKRDRYEPVAVPPTIAAKPHSPRKRVVEGKEHIHLSCQFLKIYIQCDIFQLSASIYHHEF